MAQCEGCHQDYHPIRHWQKYCSKKCYNKSHNLKRYYGITQQDWLSLLEKQKGGCAICGSSANLFVDHNHVTGAVRGLLCQNCNFAIGLFQDEPKLLKRAKDYLSGR